MSKKELIAALHQFKSTFREYVKSTELKNTDVSFKLNKTLGEAINLERALGEYCNIFPEKSEIAKKRITKVGKIFKNEIIKNKK